MQKKKIKDPQKLGRFINSLKDLFMKIIS